MPLVKIFEMKLDYASTIRKLNEAARPLEKCYAQC